MAILNHLVLLDSFTDDVMKDNVEKLECFKLYHCLRRSSTSSIDLYRKKWGALPEKFYQWLKVCDGGLLFDTVMLSINGYDRELDLNFETFDEYNAASSKEEIRLPSEYFVFAIRSYGDPICFNSLTNDGKVYLWNMEESVFEEVWDSFDIWLSSEINSAIELVEEDVLDPLAIKLGDE